MSKTIKLVDEKTIAITETNVTERLISEKNLKRKKIVLLEQIAEVDELLTYFRNEEGKYEN